MNIETKENKNVGDFSSNLNGYSGSKGKSGRAKDKDSLDKNKGSKNIGEKEENQSEQPQNAGEEKIEENMGKEKENMEEDMGKEKDDPICVGSTLCFLHTTKVKVDSSLQGDSWMYNELMTLKKRIGKMQQD